MPEHLLAGCHAEPLGSYLRGLGSFRLVSEQLDANARGCWGQDGFVLSTCATFEELVDFFLHDWLPSPMVSPWNNGAGFAREGKSPAAVAAVKAIETSTAARLAPFRATVAAARGVLVRVSDKEEIIRECRAWFPDAALPWLDAAVVLGDGGPVYPPILGSGGNLGRLELSINFMQHLARVISTGESGQSPQESAGWLRAAILGGEPVRLVDASAGQFDPGKTTGMVNPWDFILTLEGSLAFASAAARRMGATGAGKAAIPFTVDSTPVGYASASAAEGSRGELWAPLWDRLARWPEISRLLGEGRAQWGRSQARNGLDFARATASLGVDRGVNQFSRHAIVERFGQSMLAVSVGRVDVRVKPGVPVLHAVDGWVEQVKRAGEAPAGVSSALHRLELAEFRFAAKGGGVLLQEVLAALAGLEAMVGRATAFRNKGGISPVGGFSLQGLSAGDWIPALESGGGSCLEFRLAAALASLGDGRGSGSPTPTLEERRASRLALFLRPVELDSRRRLVWVPRGPSVPGLMERPLAEVLADLHCERALRVAQSGNDSPSDHRQVGVQPAFVHGLTLPFQDLARLVDGDVDDQRTAQLLEGLLLLDWSGRAAQSWSPWTGSSGPVPPALAILAPFFTRHDVSGRAASSRSTGDAGSKAASGAIVLCSQAGWPAQLAAHQVEGVLADALLRLRMLGSRDVVVRDCSVMARGVDGQRLSSALLIALSKAGCMELLDRVAPQKPDPYASSSVPSPAERIEAK